MADYLEQQCVIYQRGEISWRSTCFYASVRIDAHEHRVGKHPKSDF